MIIAIGIVALVLLLISCGVGGFYYYNSTPSSVEVESEIPSASPSPSVASVEPPSAEPSGEPPSAQSKPMGPSECQQLFYGKQYADKVSAVSNDLSKTLSPSLVQDYKGQFNAFYNVLEGPLCSCYDKLIFVQGANSTSGKREFEKCVMNNLTWAHFDNIVQYSLNQLVNESLQQTS